MVSLLGAGQEFISGVSDYLEPLRIIITYGIGNILQLDETEIEMFLSKKLLKIFTVNSIIYGGTFENLISDDDRIINNHLELNLTDNKKIYKLNEKKEPQIDIKISSRARYLRMEGEKQAGVKLDSIDMDK